MNQPRTTIDIAEPLAEFEQSKLNVPFVYNWELAYEGEPEEVVVTPKASLSQISMASAFRLGDSLPARNGVSILSLSFTVIESSIMLADRYIEEVLHLGGKNDPRLVGLDETEVLVHTLYNHLNFGFSHKGLADLKREISTVRLIVDPWVESLSIDNSGFTSGQALQESLVRIESALAYTSNIISAQVLLSTLSQSSKDASCEVVGELCDLIDGMIGSVEEICFMYNEILTELIDVMTMMIEEDPENNLHSQETKVRMHVDPIGEIRPLLSKTVAYIGDKLSRLKGQLEVKIFEE